MTLNTSAALRAAGLTAALLMTVPALAAEQIPLRDFFKNPPQSTFRLSPSGDFVSFLSPFEKRMNIHVRNGKGEVVRVTNVKDRDIGGYFWKGDQNLVYVRDNGGDENFHVYAVGRDGKNERDLTPFPGVRAQIVDALPDQDGRMLVSLNKRNPQIFDVYLLDLATGELKMVAENPGNIQEWITDHEGRIRAATTTDGVNTSLLYRKDESQPFKVVLTTNFKESVSPRFFTADNQRLIATSNIGRDKAALIEFDPESGKEVKVLFDHPDVDIETASYSRKLKKMVAAQYQTWKVQFKHFDSYYSKIDATLRKKLPRYEINLQSANKAEDRFVVAAWNDRTAGVRYLFNAKSGKLDKLAELTPWLPEKQMAAVKPIELKSRDGLTLHGYLTLPQGKDAKNLPLIVNPHGGPWARDSWGFNPEAQWLANRGYAVLQVNFRGSVGYGRKFLEASFKQWGQAMQNDITDSVQHVIKQGVADPKKICIYGASYGGYATLAGLTYTPDLYACGVDYVGVSNLNTFMTTIPPYWKPMLAMMHEMVGDPVKDKAMLDAYSPALNADKIKAPLLVLQGAKDPRVVKAESDQMVEALKKRGVDVEYIVKDNEGHGFRNEENRFEAYEAMERFFAKHLKS